MKNTPEGDSNLLDQSLIVYGSGLSDGNGHTHDQLPTLLAGPRRRVREPGPAHHLPARDAGDQSLRHDDRADWRARRARRRFDRPARRSVADARFGHARRRAGSGPARAGPDRRRLQHLDGAAGCRARARRAVRLRHPARRRASAPCASPAPASTPRSSATSSTASTRRATCAAATSGLPVGLAAVVAAAARSADGKAAVAAEEGERRADSTRAAFAA